MSYVPRIKSKYSSLTAQDHGGERWPFKSNSWARNCNCWASRLE